MKLLGAIAAVASLGVLALPAGAQASPTSCPDETLCVWAKTDYRGERVTITKVNHVSNKLSNEMNNKASSLKNRISRTGQLYDKKNGGPGDAYGFCDNDNVSDLVSFNGLASSSIVGSEMMRQKRICKRKAADKASNKSCPDGYVCVWTKKNFRGHKAKTKKVGEYVDYDDPIRNNISSIKNRWDNLTYFADGHQGHGASFAVCGGDSVKNLATYGSMPPVLNDFAASAYLMPTDEPCGP